MLALDRQDSDIAPDTALGPVEPVPMIPAMPPAPAHYGQQADRKRFAAAFSKTALIHIAALLALLTWHVATDMPPSKPHLTVTMLPASPPAPPAPKPVRQEKVKPVTSKAPAMRPVQSPQLPPALAAVVPVALAPAAVALAPPMPSPPPMPVAASAPAATPPSPPVSTTGKDSWEARVVARLESLKRYPPAARSRRDQGVAKVRFRVNRQGHLLSSSLESSSGSRLLDQEALATVARAQPFPPIPAGRPDEIEVVVPIEFFLGRHPND
ncbi:TonB family protein [Novosphingobium sp.]|uniref:energy transducer TonB n=1 Tax=Novosphingobium sp. TaxID=1874826 RepID=UPI0031E3521E